jgi:hypothetical protein
MFLLPCKLLLELEAIKRTDLRLALSHSEGISNQSSLFLFVKLISARGQYELFCSFLSEKGECRRRNGLIYLMSSQGRSRIR